MTWRRKVFAPAHEDGGKILMEITMKEKFGAVEVGDATFAQEVLHSPLPVLVDFWAPWCGPCRMLAPVVSELAGELLDSVKVAKINVDENPATAAQYQVRSIPTRLLFRGGEPMAQMVGAAPKSQTAATIRRHLRDA